MLRTWLIAFCLSLPTVALALPADEPVDPNMPKQQAEPPRTRGGNAGSGEHYPPPPRGETSSSDFARSAGSSSWPITVDFHAGLTFASEDPDVRTNWEHEIWYSYLVSAGAYWNFPRMFGGEFWLFAGVDYSYLHDEEQLTSDDASSYLHSDTMEFFATGGLGWQPKAFLEGHAGFRAFVSAPMWAQKTTTFDAKDYTHDMGSRDITTFAYGLNAFYDIDHHWKPYVGYEYRVNSIMTLGMNYAF